MDAWTTLWASWVVKQTLPGATGAGCASVYLRRVSPFIAIRPFLVSVSNQTSICSDTGYMATSGACAIFEGLVPISLSFGWRADGDSFSINVEILCKHCPFDIAMLPIWRGGTLSFIARLGFRVSPSSLRTNLQPPHTPIGGTARPHSRLPPHRISRDAGAGSAHAQRAARSPLARDAFCDVCRLRHRGARPDRRARAGQTRDRWTGRGRGRGRADCG